MLRKLKVDTSLMEIKDGLVMETKMFLLYLQEI
jgi:hypothetical protein